MYCHFGPDFWIQLIVLLLSLIAILVSIYSLRKQLEVHNFSEYTRRYKNIILNFPESINESTFDINSLSKEERDKTMRYMRAYFDLCFEEFYLYKNKLIKKTLWSLWREGIEFALSKPAFKDAWSIIKTDTNYGDEFKNFINESTG